jgi:phosphoserine phosphatase
MRWKLACFDLDGTLARPVSTGVHLARKMGHAEVMTEMEARYHQGKATNAEVAAGDAQYYAGYSKASIDELLQDIPTIAHIPETIAYLASKHIPSIICTLAWDFVAESFAKRYGFIGWSGPSLAIDPDGLFTGEVLADFLETDKPLFVRDYCSRHNLKMPETFHVGDSRSDLPLFREVGFSIALNGTEQAKSLASVSIESDSLLEVLPLIPGLA